MDSGARGRDRVSERASHKGKEPPPSLSPLRYCDSLRVRGREGGWLRSQLARDILVIRASISPGERQSPLYSGEAGGPSQLGRPPDWRAIAIWAAFSIRATVFVRGMAYVALTACRIDGGAAAPAHVTYYNATAAAISPCFDNDDLTSSPPLDATVAARGCGGSFSCAEERSRGQYSADMHSAFLVAA